ncbi:MAG: hypothetical protein OXG71_01690 [Rhodospirillales bacterium]|nr:hypothetical protein [Rhodospirillales bacterium]
MTCCVSLRRDRGSVFLSDTRSNAGTDDISVFRKMFTWVTSGEPVIMLIATGKLTTTLAATSLLDERTKSPPGRKPSLLEAPPMFQVDGAVGDTLRDMKTNPQDRSPT